MLHTPDVVRVDADHIAGEYKNLAIFIWRNETTPEAVRRASQQMHSLYASYQEGVGILQVVEESAASPSPECRKALMELLQTGAPAVKCSTVIHEGTGFRAAAVRSVVTTLNLLVRPKFPHKVYSTVEEAVDWQASVLPAVNGRAWSPADMLHLIRQLRAQLDEHTTANVGGL